MKKYLHAHHGYQAPHVIIAYDDSMCLLYLQMVDGHTTLLRKIFN